MAHEQSELFAPAARSLPEATKAALGRAFIVFDAKQPRTLAASSEKLQHLLRKYDS
jgi:hypothetical protein